MIEMYSFASVLMDPMESDEGTRTLAGTVTVPPNAWTVVLIGGEAPEADTDVDNRVAVQVFHANAEPLTLSVFDDGSTKVVGEMPPDGYREQRKPYVDSVLGIAERQAAQLAQAVDNAYPTLSALDGHPLNTGADERLATAVRNGHIVRTADGYRITESGRIEAARMLGVDPETIVL